MSTKKKTRVRRSFTLEEKLTAVLMVWTDRRTITQICTELNLSWTLLDRWQNQAMEGMLSALESKKNEHSAQLNSRVEKLLDKKLAARGDSFVKLTDRLAAVQQKRRPAS